MSLDIGVDLQLQIFILAGVFGFIAIMLVFFLAGVCGQLSKLKRQQKKLQADRSGPIAGYDNYAFSSRRDIQPDEELGRRGFTMYDPYRNSNQPNVHQSLTNEKQEPTQETAQETTVTDSETPANVEGAHDDYSIANTETIVLEGNDAEMKIQRRSYPPEFHGIPPPPAFVNRFDIGIEPNTSNAKPDDRQ